MLSAYIPVLILFGFVLAFVVAGMLVSDLAGRKRSNLEKESAYECGMDAVGNARVRISIHYYLIAVLFILFDVEGIFLMLWSTAAKSFQAAGAGALVFTEILVFVAMLVVALVFVWRKGGLEWDR